jgi:hypothetical protein
MGVYPGCFSAAFVSLYHSFHRARYVSEKVFLVSELRKVRPIESHSKRFSCSMLLSISGSSGAPAKESRSSGFNGRRVVATKEGSRLEFLGLK